MTDSLNCYALATTLRAGRSGAELDAGYMDAWLADLRGVSLQQALPALIVKLDRMSRVALPAAERLAVMGKVKRPLLKATAGLPKHFGAGRGQDTQGAQSLLLEQRLYCLMAKNLMQGLQDLDRSMDAFTAEVDKRRRWALRNLFRFLGRQVELGLFWGRSLPPQTWQELHDLYSYVASRGIARVGGKTRRARNGRELDLAREYKRLLLLGLLPEGVTRERPRNSIVQDELDSWAEETTLVSPDSYVGAYDVYVAETSTDRPPRRIEGALMESFRGWVVQPAMGFLDYIATAAQDDHPVRVPVVAMRSVSGMN